MQTTIDFTHVHENNPESQAAYNEGKQHFRGQTKDVYELLLSGVRLSAFNCRDYGIMHLPSRIRDLRKGKVFPKVKMIGRVKEWYL